MRDVRERLRIAGAVHGRFLPPRTGRLLRKAERRLDWQDALLCAGGELQVATERMRYTGDPRPEVTEHRLAALTDGTWMCSAVPQAR